MAANYCPNRRHISDSPKFYQNNSHREINSNESNSQIMPKF
jgi:hypothetical protein